MRLHEINNHRTFTPTSPRDSNPSIRGFNETKIVGKGTKDSPYVIEGAESRKDVLEFLSVSGLSNIIASGDWVLLVVNGGFIETRWYAPTSSLWRANWIPTGWNPASGSASAFVFEGGNPASNANFTIAGDPGTTGTVGDYSFIRSGLNYEDVLTMAPAVAAPLGNSIQAFQIDGFHLGQALNGGSSDPDYTVRIEQFSSAYDPSGRYPLVMCNQGANRNINSLDDNLNFQLDNTGGAYDTNITVFSSPEDPVFIEVYQDFDSDAVRVYANYSIYPIAVFFAGLVTSPSVSPAPAFRLFVKNGSVGTPATGFNEMRFLSFSGCEFSL